MKRTKATLYFYNDDEEALKQLKSGQVNDSLMECAFVGRKLPQQEYDDISLEDLQDAIDHSTAGLAFATDKDMRIPPEFYDLDVDGLKKALKEEGIIIIREPEPTFRHEFPPITRGPRKGYPNFKKMPVTYWDRLYSVECESEVVSFEGEIDINDEEESFTVVKVAAGDVQ